MNITIIFLLILSIYLYTRYIFEKNQREQVVSSEEIDDSQLRLDELEVEMVRIEEENLKMKEKIKKRNLKIGILFGFTLVLLFLYFKKRRAEDKLILSTKIKQSVKPNNSLNKTSDALDDEFENNLNEIQEKEIGPEIREILRKKLQEQEAELQKLKTKKYRGGIGAVRMSYQSLDSQSQSSIGSQRQSSIINSKNTDVLSSSENILSYPSTSTDGIRYRKNRKSSSSKRQSSQYPISSNTQSKQKNKTRKNLNYIDPFARI
mgnify:CR=1 FL=1|tara:strand:- start:1304 stop:2089 length:786 start_codon:yes stop_codon:yes gene_type:complete